MTQGYSRLSNHAYCLDDKGNKQNYELGMRDMDCAYERILDEMQADPRDEPDYY
jgi:hypothetical protein